MQDKLLDFSGITAICHCKGILPCPFGGCEVGSSQCELQTLNCTDCDIRPRIQNLKLECKDHTQARVHKAPCKFLLGEAEADPLTAASESLKCQLLDTPICKSQTLFGIFGTARATYPLSYLLPAVQSHRGATSWQHRLPTKSHLAPNWRFLLPIPAKTSRPSNSGEQFNPVCLQAPRQVKDSLLAGSLRGRRQ